MAWTFITKAVRRRPKELSDEELVQKFDERLNPAFRDLLKIAGIGTEGLLNKAARSIVPEAITGYGGGFVDPPYDAFQLQIVADRHWVARLCIEKLTRESTRQGWRFEPLYEVKCETCGSEYDYMPQSGVVVRTTRVEGRSGDPIHRRVVLSEIAA